MQFLYADDMYHFMDQESYEQVSFNENQITSAKNYLKEEIIYNIVTIKN